MDYLVRVLYMRTKGVLRIRDTPLLPLLRRLPLVVQPKILDSRSLKLFFWAFSDSNSTFN
jgi:hypothetical protein